MSIKNTIKFIIKNIPQDTKNLQRSIFNSIKEKIKDFYKNTNINK